ncbi:hypothetical protein [Flavobacterium sp. 3HN19-14]|uniref:hypothetical protein n=1 Tax=Flavobacterium sp. 3HN19-14 TaxID=3448133 RepID=UPI003EDF9CDA
MFTELEINKYAVEDLPKLEATIAKVVAFVKDNEEKYDHRWINFHGMDALLNGMDEKAETKKMTEPKSKWAKIKTKTIAEYAEGFQGFLKQMRK